MKGSKFIVVAGCYRSGTTALFNLVRLILKHSNMNYASYFWEGKSVETDAYQLIKTHTYSDGLAEEAYKIFTTHRKRDEMMESMRLLSTMDVDPVFGNAADPNNFEVAMSNAIFWQRKSDYISNYNIMVYEPERIIIDISVILGATIPEIEISLDRLQAIISEFKSLKAPKSGFDKETLLTETHYNQR